MVHWISGTEACQEDCNIEHNEQHRRNDQDCDYDRDPTANTQWLGRGLIRLRGGILNQVIHAILSRRWYGAVTRDHTHFTSRLVRQFRSGDGLLALLDPTDR